MKPVDNYNDDGPDTALAHLHMAMKNLEEARNALDDGSEPLSRDYTDNAIYACGEAIDAAETAIDAAETASGCGG